MVPIRQTTPGDPRQDVLTPQHDVLTPHQTVLAIFIAVAMLVVVIELVRKRKLREEYAFLWIGTAVLLTIMALWTDVLGWFKAILDAQTDASTLFFGAIIFLMLVALQFSIRLTKLTFRNKSLSQKVAILTKEVEDLREALQAGGSGHPGTGQDDRHGAGASATRTEHAEVATHKTEVATQKTNDAR